MAIDLGGGRRLVFADLTGWGWLWPATGLVALVLLLALYRYERRLVSRRAGLSLLGLRLLAALALLIALLDPVAARTRHETVRGRVIVGLDRSASMDTADPQRPEPDRARLASALGLSPGEDPGTLPRLEIARRLFAGSPGLASALESDHAVEALSFARDAAPGKLADVLAEAGRPRPDGDPSRSSTDWGPALQAAAQQSPDGSPVIAAVLLTDGRRNSPAPPPTDEAQRLASLGVPVFPILVGSTVPPRDAAIASLRAPESAYLGDTATVTVEVKADGFPPGTPIPVRLDRPGAEPMEQTVTAPGPDAPRPTATFRVELPEAGPQTLTASVASPGGPDTRPDNDGRARTVIVNDDKARVLIIDGEARWEFRYLRNALIRDPRVEVQAVLTVPPPSPGTAEATYASELPPAPAAGSGEPDPLGSFDVIVLGDLPPDAAPADLWPRLDAFVASRGGTLVMVAGPRSWPSAWSDQEQARGLLPVTSLSLVTFDPALVDPERPALPAGAHLRPAVDSSASADQWPMLQFDGDPNASQAVWESLAPMPWALAGRPKPGASVLVAAEGADPDSSAVMAAQPYGLGKVLWVGTDGTWRWRLRVGDLYHHRFWGQVVRWGAGGSLSSGNRLVRFGPDRPRSPEGEPPTFQARFADGTPGVSPSLLAVARLERVPADGGAPTPVGLLPLRPAADRPGVFEGSAPPLPPGRYVARLDVPELAETFRSQGLEPPNAPFEVAERETNERIELAASRDALDRLASATGGRLLLDHEARQLPELLRARRIDRTYTEETPLWDSPLPLVLFFGVLSLEWVVRKRAGLP